MSKTINMNSPISHGDYFVNLPAPSEIPVKRISEAVARLVDLDRKAVAIVRAAQDAERAQLDAVSADAIRMAKLYESGEGDDANPREATDAADQVLAQSRARIQPIRTATVTAYRELRETVAGNKAEWQRAARKNVEGARDKLALALKSARLQHAELEASMGVLEMLAGEELPPRNLVADWAAGRGELENAIETLSAAVVRIDRAAREL